MSRNIYNGDMTKDFVIIPDLIPYDEKQEGKGDYNIVALATTFGNRDRQNEIIDSNAFNSSVKRINEGDSLKILLNHNRDRAMGSWTKAVKTATGIKLYGNISEATRETQDMLALVKDKVYDKVSIGFIVNDFDEVNGAFRVLKGELVECSIVAVPANNSANILSVKEYNEMMSKEDLSAEDENCYNVDNDKQEKEFNEFYTKLKSKIFTYTGV